MASIDSRAAVWAFGACRTTRQHTNDPVPADGDQVRSVDRHDAQVVTVGAKSLPQPLQRRSNSRVRVRSGWSRTVSWIFSGLLSCIYRPRAQRADGRNSRIVETSSNRTGRITRGIPVSVDIGVADAPAARVGRLSGDRWTGAGNPTVLVVRSGRSPGQGMGSDRCASAVPPAGNRRPVMPPRLPVAPVARTWSCREVCSATSVPDAGAPAISTMFSRSSPRMW